MEPKSVGTYKWFPVVVGLFTAILVISNIGATKISQVGWLVFDGATILFPLTYIFGDILTEVYGYKRSRIAIWTAFAAQVVMVLAFWSILALPSAPDWKGQAAMSAVLGFVPRIVIASLIGFFCGEFANSFVLSKMKILTKGKHLWQRTIGSTIVGECVDTLLFVFIAFLGVLPLPVVLAMIPTQYLIKVGVEVLFTPVTYAVVGWLKKVENEDVYDVGVSYNPFSLEVD